MSEITRILDRMHDGDPTVAEELLPLVYDELRKLAGLKMAQQPAGNTLQATALVHEAWLKLAGSGKQDWASRRQFFAAAAAAMRHILIDRAQKKQRLRHGQGQEHIPIEDVEFAAPTGDETLLSLDEAMHELEREHPAKAEMVKLKFFVGLGEREIAELLGVSERTVERHWAYAQAWLFDRISREQSP